VKITHEDRAAISEIQLWLKAKTKSDRFRITDIFIDALWAYLKRLTGKTKEDIRKNLPQELWTPDPQPSNNITVMPKLKKKARGLRR
jgi:hypothetical protein